MSNIIERINELAAKAKNEGLNEDEMAERDMLRRQYIEEFRSKFKEQLKNIKVVDETGRDITPQKIRDLKG